MNELINALSRLLSDVILPTLKGVQTRQAEQMAQSDRIEAAIDELREHIEAQFNHLNSQLVHNLDELTRLRATLVALQVEQASYRGSTELVH